MKTALGMDGKTRWHVIRKMSIKRAIAHMDDNAFAYDVIRDGTIGVYWEKAGSTFALFDKCDRTLYIREAP